MIIKPQPTQEKFLSNPADIVIYGGAAGGGKTYAIIMECLRHINNPGFRAVIFRRTTAQLTNSGSIFDVMCPIFLRFGAKINRTKLSFTFPSGAVIECSHMQHAKDKYNWQGAQITLIIFEELGQFEYEQFIYLISRNRSTCGIKPYVRATCNPEPDSWLSKFIAYYIGDDGTIDDNKDGAIRYFITQNDEHIWASTKEELIETHGDDCLPKSFSFIKSSVYDNKALLDVDPNYLSNLKALSAYQRKILLEGNWLVKLVSGLLFKREYFEIIDTNNLPKDLQFVRAWDRAGTKPNPANPDPDYTVGLKLGFSPSLKNYYVLDIVRLRDTPAIVRQSILNTAKQDGQQVKIILEQEPGSSGIADVDDIIKMLNGFVAKKVKPSTNKVNRADPVSAQAESGNIKLISAAWNDSFLAELENFPDNKFHDDQVDGLSMAYNFINQTPQFIMPKFV